MTQLSILSHVLMYGSVTLYNYNRIPYNQRGGTRYRKGANNNTHCHFNFFLTFHVFRIISAPQKWVRYNWNNYTRYQ